jgi:predicted transcriptional regulator
MASAYNVTLDPSLNDDLSQMASDLNITKDEAVRRALELFKHASKAQNIELTLQGGEKQAVRIK